MKCLLSFLALVLTFALHGEMPFYMLRLRAVETDDVATWEETRQAISDNPGCCDEVWFSTGIGYPTLAAHRERAAKQAKAAADCCAMGIAPGLQIQATLGHFDGSTGQEDAAARDWTGWTGSQGVVDRFCSCPRDPKFIAYFEEVGRIYASYRPTSVWIDDDLRIDNHNPASIGSLNGCWCDRCVGDFAEREEKSYTRETLAASAKVDTSLYRRWERFQFESLATLAGRIAKAIVVVSPETRMGYQHCMRADGLQTLVYEAMAEASGHAVRSRPGGGAYYDHDPRNQLAKAYVMMRQRATLAGTKVIEQFCPEIETYPRKFACRTPRGVLLEALENLALGMDSLSLLITDTRYERMAWYGRTFFRTLSKNRACLKGYADQSIGTEPAGLYVDASGLAGDVPGEDWMAACSGVRWEETCSGIPLINGPGRRLGDYAEFVRSNGGKLDVSVASTEEIIGRSRLADQVAGGKLPVILMDPMVAFVMPRLTSEGELRTIVVINATIGRTEPTRLRLRSIPVWAKRGMWWALDATAMELPLMRDGNDTIVVLPSIDGWSGGWLGFER